MTDAGHQLINFSKMFSGIEFGKSFYPALYIGITVPEEVDVE